MMAVHQVFSLVMIAQTLAQIPTVTFQKLVESLSRKVDFVTALKLKPLNITAMVLEFDDVEHLLSAYFWSYDVYVHVHTSVIMIEVV